MLNMGVERRPSTTAITALFVQTPTGELHSLKNLPKQLKVFDIKARLELLTGLLSHTYILHISGASVTLTDAHLEGVAQERLRNGSILKLRLLPEWEALHSAICQRDVAAALQEGLVAPLCDRHGGDLDVLRQSVRERCAVAIFMAAHQGLTHLLAKLHRENTGILESRSSFGRTPIFMAVAKDDLSTVLCLNSLGADIDVEDRFGISLLGVATLHKAFTCERWLKIAAMQKKAANVDKRLELEFGEAPKKNNGSSENIKPDKAMFSKHTLSFLKGCQQGSKVDLTEYEQGLHWYGGRPLGTPGRYDHEPTSKSQTPADSLASKANKTFLTEDSGRVQSSPQSHQSCRIKIEEPQTDAEDKPRPKTCEIPYDYGRCGSAKFHVKCYKRPPFVMKRKIPLEEQHLVTVEFDLVDLAPSPATSRDRPTKSSARSSKGTKSTSVSESAGSATSRTKSSEHSAKENSVNTKRQRSHSSGTRSYPKYYETQFHKMMKAVEEYKGRPETANSRFRFWKTWLVEKHQELENRPLPTTDEVDKKQKNEKAYRVWLRKKYSTSSSDEDDSVHPDVEIDVVDEANDKLIYNRWRPYDEALTYEKWKKKKAKQEEKEKHTKEMLANIKRAALSPTVPADRFESLHRIDPEDPVALHQKHPITYLKAHREQANSNSTYQRWRRLAPHPCDQFKEHNEEEMTEIRNQMRVNGITYEEWVSFKEHEMLVQDKQQQTKADRNAAAEREKKKQILEEKQKRQEEEVKQRDRKHRLSQQAREPVSIIPSLMNDSLDDKAKQTVYKSVQFQMADGRGDYRPNYCT